MIAVKITKKDIEKKITLSKEIISLGEKGGNTETYEKKLASHLSIAAVNVSSNILKQLKDATGTDAEKKKAITEEIKTFVETEADKIKQLIEKLKAEETAAAAAPINLAGALKELATAQTK